MGKMGERSLFFVAYLYKMRSLAQNAEDVIAD
jgi:hypothetical protein